jgi:hypothetical protein
MNYQKIYDDLIDRARGRVIEEYTEKHHIVPRCMGGNNAKINLVRLTPEEHYLAHQLLVKIHPEHHGLIKAALRMTTHTTKRRVNNKLFGWLKRRFSKSMSGDNNPARRIPGLQARAGAKRRGQKRTAETRKNMSESLAGKPFTEEHLANLREGAANRKRPWDNIPLFVYSKNGEYMIEYPDVYECSKSLKVTVGMIKGVVSGKNQHVMELRIFDSHQGDSITPLVKSNANKGKPKTEEHLKSLKASLTEKCTCIHCGFESTKSAIGRYHNDRCKHNPIRVDVQPAKITEHVCPHCNATGKGSVMFRHHFDNCKHKKETNENK